MVWLIFALSAGLVVYTLAGYPVVLWFLTAGRPIGRRQTSGPVPRVTVVLPVRNGERWIAGKLASLAALEYPRSALEIVVVDDGSTDRSAEVAGAWPGVELLRLPAAGKAVALNAGMARASGDVLFFTDVRQPLAPDSLRLLVDRLAEPGVGVASGELIIRQGTTREESDVGLYWRYEKWIRRRQSELGVVPGATGCIYAMRRELARPLPPGTLVDDMYLPLRAYFQGCRIVFESRAHAFDEPTDLPTEFRRKVRTLAGNYQIIARLPHLLLPCHPMWIHFTSHKLGRLLLPAALVLLLGSSAWLPSPWREAALLPQLTGYLLAAADPLVPQSSALKRVSSPARTFVVLMAAAAYASTYLLPGTRDFWKPTRGRPGAGR